MTQHTIYHRHGIGEGALDGIRAAGARIQAARRQLMKQPPAPIPALEVPAPPELPQIRGCGLTWGGHAGGNAAMPLLVATDEDGRQASGSVASTILRMLHPAELLQLTERAEALATELEAAAEEREATIERLVQEAVRDADPAIRALGERLSEARREEQEREAWIREHGSARLRRLLEEGIEHEAVYRDERLALERPGWRYDLRPLPGTPSEPRNAPERALDLLDEARKTAPDAHLVYWRAYLPCNCEHADEGYCDEEDGHEVHGYTCKATFLRRTIVYRVADDGTPPVVIGEDD